MADLRRAVFLDRDGTLNHDAGYTHKVEELRLVENAVEGLVLLSSLGLPLVVVTNQSGIARGYYTEEQMHLFHEHLAAALAEHGVTIERFYHCPNLPDAPLEAYRRDCGSRKPDPGMLLQAAHELSLDLRGSYVVGDKLADVKAGQAVGCTSILVLTGEKGADESLAVTRPDYVAADLLAAARFIESDLQVSRRAGME